MAFIISDLDVAQRVLRHEDVSEVPRRRILGIVLQRELKCAITAHLNIASMTTEVVLDPDHVVIRRDRVKGDRFFEL